MKKLLNYNKLKFSILRNARNYEVHYFNSIEFKNGFHYVYKIHEINVKNTTELNSIHFALI